METIAKRPFNSYMERKKDCKFRRLEDLQEICKFTAKEALKERKKDRNKEKNK